MRVMALILFFVLSACRAGEIKSEGGGRRYSSVEVSQLAARVPVEEFFRNPTVMGYRISPDGHNLAVLKSWKSRMNIFVHPTDHPTEQKQITFIEDRDLYRIYWKGSEHLIFTMDSGGDENDHVYIVNIQTGSVKDLTPFKGVKAALADDLEESAPNHILIAHNQRNPEAMDLYRVNILTGESQLVKQNDQKIDSWLVDHSGQVRGGTASDGISKVFYFETSKGKPWKTVLKTDFRNNFEPIGFTADNRRLYVITNLNRDLDALVEVDPQMPSGEFIRSTIFAHGKNDVTEAQYSELNKTISRVTVVTDRRETTLLNRKDRKDWSVLQQKLNGASLTLGSTSRDERYWVVKTVSDLSRGSYYLYDRQQQQITDLGNLSPWLDPELMSEMKSVSYKSRDGLRIPAYLTVPRGVEPKNLPVVINVHGGPWARDEWGFDSEVQFLASRGYAVLQINYRGSTGYGRKFWQASFKQWGRNMQNDISDGVEWLKSQGLADQKRICIYGGSYGGYATLAGITLTPDLYACAVDYVGISNMFTFLNSIPPYWKPYLDMLHVMVGHPEKDQEMLRSVSPVFHADRIKAPLFVAQGANDPRVKKAESDQIVEALRRRGVAVEYMVKDNEGHGFRNEENRFDFYRAMEKFLAKYLGGRA